MNTQQESVTCGVFPQGDFLADYFRLREMESERRNTDIADTLKEFQTTPQEDEP